MSAVGLTDLVKALQAFEGKPVRLEELGSLFGYGYRPQTKEASTEPSAGFHADEKPPPPQVVSASRSAPVPFWRLVAVDWNDAIYRDQPPPPNLGRGQPLKVRQLELPSQPLPEPPPRWPPGRAASRLVVAGTQLELNGPADLMAAVEQISRCEAVQELPRLPRRRVIPNLTVTVDIGPHLWPVRADQRALVAWLRRWCLSGALDVRVLRRPPSGRRGPIKGTELLLTDLGAFAGSHAVEAWRREGLRRKDRSQPTVVWLLCDPRRLPQAALRPWDVLIAERTPQPESVDELLELASLAVQVDAELLRGLRCLLPQNRFGPDAELEAWTSESLRRADGSVAQWEPKAFRRYRDALLRRAGAPGMEDRILGAIREIARFRRYSEGDKTKYWVSEEVFHEEVVSWQGFAEKLPDSLRNRVLELLAADWVGESETFLEDVEATVSANSLDPELMKRAVLERWFERVKVLGEPRTWTKPGAPLYRIGYALQAEPATESSSVRSIRQTHKGLVLGDEGSWVATLETGVPILGVETDERHIEVPFRAGVTLDLLPPTEPRPAWAVDVGQDEYGRWADAELAGVRFRLRWIPPGTFLMGSPEDEPGRYDDEGPQHPVTLTQGFWMAEAPCTQRLWQAVMGENPSGYRGDDHPVEEVSYVNVQAFLDRAQGLAPELDLQLPSEAEWEYACRAGTTEATYAGPLTFDESMKKAPELDAIAWYRGNSGLKGTKSVKQKRPNAWGLFDMLGNVDEWCADDMRRYEAAPAENPLGDMKGAQRVIRGGGWNNPAQYVRAAYRYADVPSNRYDNLGFRFSRGQAALRQGRAEPARKAGRGAGAEPPGTPGTNAVVLITDRARCRLEGLHRPPWAAYLGRDPFGLFADIAVPARKKSRPEVEARLRWIPPGRFWMGSPMNEAGRFDTEIRHLVTLTEGFWLADTPCTQRFWAAVMGENPSRFKGERRPVEQVSFDDVLKFFEAVNQQLPGLGLRLPSEAEWEYACRARTTEATYNGNLTLAGNSAPELEEIAWYGENSEGETHPVKMKRPNPWGLFDMLGNVDEWCRDSMRTYGSEPVENPLGDMEGTQRVLRGGGWGDPAQYVRAAYRFAYDPSNRNDDLGFRFSRGQAAPGKKGPGVGRSPT